MPRWTPEARKRQSDIAWSWWGNHDKRYRNPERQRTRQILEAWRKHFQLYGKCKRENECICGGICMKLTEEKIRAELGINGPIDHPLLRLHETIPSGDSLEGQTGPLS